MKSMKNKRTVPFYQYIISLLCVAFLAGGSSYIYFDHRVKKMSQEGAITNDDLSKVQDLYNEISTNYVGEVDKNELVEGALKGMSEAIGDPYSTYLNESAANDLNESLSGDFEGIGATMTMKDGEPVVAEAPVADSPAEKAGIKEGDIIEKVDGTATKGMKLAEVVSKVRGKKGTSVELTIQREGETKNISIKRGKIPVKTVTGELDKNDAQIGSIKITSFGKKTYQELKETITNLRAKGAKSFVIDVRQNPGGLLDQAERMASMFLKNGETIVQFEDKKGRTMKEVASKELDDGFKVKEPVAVIIDGNSASASEIFAAALHESANVPLIGTKTFGKGTVQTVKDLNDQTEIKLTVLKWLTPKGEWINEKGIEPTIKADYPEYAYLKLIPRDKTLKEGDQSEDIQNLNAILAVLAYPVDENNANYTAETKAAVSDLQQKNGLPVTGEIDNETATKIEATLGKLILENDAAYDTAVKEIQKN
ncbi:S41 family peptidase [Enterococcus faecalis]|uniref:S41 family peptidase n=1 Tax=Enterococcus TaxID=1350 RepID=UPI00296C9717|nr:S41 family peptidase [Enterococcus faecalis]